MTVLSLACDSAMLGDRMVFGSLLIQAGVSPAYVQKQMGHSSIQVTVDTYGHLIPSENAAWINTLDLPAAKTTSGQIRTSDAHTPRTARTEP